MILNERGCGVCETMDHTNILPYNKAAAEREPSSTHVISTETKQTEMVRGDG